MKLDGTENPKPTPFDAHEQVVRGPHGFDKEKGYGTTDPVHTFNEKGEPVALHEYPKVLESHDEDGKPILEPVVAKDEAHEAELREQIEAAKEK